MVYSRLCAAFHPPASVLARAWSFSFISFTSSISLTSAVSPHPSPLFQKFLIPKNLPAGSAKSLTLKDLVPKPTEDTLRPNVDLTQSCPLNNFQTLCQKPEVYPNVAWPSCDPTPPLFFGRISFQRSYLPGSAKNIIPKELKNKCRASRFNCVPSPSPHSPSLHCLRLSPSGSRGVTDRRTWVMEHDTRSAL
jgi:hypothetical protein